MDRKILLGMMMIGLVAALAGAGLYAYFNDTETSTGNIFTAGTLDLQYKADPAGDGYDDDGWQDGTTVSYTFEGISPRNPEHTNEVQLRYLLRNVGDMPGYLGIEFHVYANDDNGLTEPESEVDSTDGPGAGELYKLVAYWGYATDGGMPACCGLIEKAFDGLEGYIWSRETVASDFGEDSDQYLRCFGPGAEFDLLGSGEEIELWITVYLPEDVGNEVQSDSIKLDIIFHLAQVPSELK